MLRGENNMRKLVKRSTSALIITVMLLMLGTTAFAAEAKTVEVVGYDYDWEFLTKEEVASMSAAHFSVSNVIDTFDVKEIDEYIDEGLIVSPSSTVTVLAEDDGVMFDVYKMTPIGDNTYEYHDEDRLPVSGKVKVYAIDETGAVDEDGYPLVVEKIIDASEIGNYDDEFPEYLPGCTVTLTEPGDYYVVLRIEALAGAASAIVRVTGETVQTENPAETDEPVDSEPATEPELPVSVSALPTNSKVLVNGAETSFDAYNINGNNYFKLRDLATVVNGTEKQFEVEWDSEKNAINLVSDKSYTTAGGEMTEGDGKEKTGNLNTAKIYKDGEEIELTAYNINDNNYFKLRDIAQAFNIGITWDNLTMTIGIDTTIGYTAE